MREENLGRQAGRARLFWKGKQPLDEGVVHAQHQDQFPPPTHLHEVFVLASRQERPEGNESALLGAETTAEEMHKPNCKPTHYFPHILRRQDLEALGS